MSQVSAARQGGQWCGLPTATSAVLLSGKGYLRQEQRAEGIRTSKVCLFGKATMPARHCPPPSPHTHPHHVTDSYSTLLRTIPIPIGARSSASSQFQSVPVSSSQLQYKSYLPKRLEELGQVGADFGGHLPRRVQLLYEERGDLLKLRCCWRALQQLCGNDLNRKRLSVHESTLAREHFATAFQDHEQRDISTLVILTLTAAHWGCCG